MEPSARGLRRSLQPFKRPNSGKNFRNVSLGDHNICLYASPRERCEILYSNLKAAIGRGYSALYIAGEESVASIQAEMRSFGLKLDNPNKLKIVAARQWYIPDGEFQADRVVALYRRSAEESLDNGFKGLYVLTDVADILDYFSNDLTSWLNFENSLGRTFRFPMKALCAYHIDQMETKNQVLPQLIHAHKGIITSKTANFLDCKKLYVDAFTETLNGLLGREASKVIFYHVETTYKLSQDQIADNTGEFYEALKSIFDGATPFIEQEISRNLLRKIKAE